MISKHLILTIFTITIGSSFQFGYQTAVINAPMPVIEDFIKEVGIERDPTKPFSDSFITILGSLIVAMFPVGGLVGAMLGGVVSEYFGRKSGLMVTALPTMIGSCLMGASRACMSFEMIIAGRFIIGMSCGVYSGLAPVYLTEIAPKNIKGASGIINQMAIVLAVLFSNLLGLTDLLGNARNWPFLLGLTIIPCLIHVVLLPFCPDSPCHLMLSCKDEVAARAALVSLRGGADIEDEILEMNREAQAATSTNNLSFKEFFGRSYLRLGLIIGIGMQMSQQLTGVNAIINYSEKMFTAAGFSEEDGVYATIGIGVVNCVLTLVSVFIVDRLGRRPLHLLGLSGMFVFMGLYSLCLALHHMAQWISIASIACIYLFICFFGIGPGSIPWFIVAEMFTQEARGIAMTIAITVNWICQIAIGLGYPQLLTFLGNYSTVPFVVILFLSILFTYKMVPETKNRTPEEVEWELKQRTQWSAEYLPISTSIQDATDYGAVTTPVGGNIQA